jgi:hypothetical protein
MDRLNMVNLAQVDNAADQTSRLTYDKAYPQALVV